MMQCQKLFSFYVYCFQLAQPTLEAFVLEVILILFAKRDDQLAIAPPVASLTVSDFDVTKKETLVMIRELAIGCLSHKHVHYVTV